MFKTIAEDIHCVFERDPAARTSFEVITTYPGIHALIAHRINHRLWGWGLRWLARVGSNVARLTTGIEIHPAACVGRRCFIDHGMGVVIGETASLGDDCTLYHEVTLGGTSWKKGKRHPSLGNNVVVGAGAKVLGPIHIGDGARIGSNAVVVKDVPAASTAIGIPARVIPRERDEGQRRREEMASRMGFDAYGATKDMPDPVANAINCILEHLHLLDERVDVTSHELKKLGAVVDDSRLPEIDPKQIEGIALEQATADEVDDEAVATERAAEKVVD